MELETQNLALALTLKSKMPKFYVQSGSLQLITTATDPRAAAIWAVHRALAPALPFLSEEADTVAAPEVPRCGPVAALGETVHVSERGFEQDDGVTYQTLEIVTQWNQLLLAVDRLQKRLAACEV
jgi:hypothetical protein